jgi:hypothetical protein
MPAHGHPDGHADRHVRGHEDVHLDAPAQLGPQHPEHDHRDEHLEEVAPAPIAMHAWIRQHADLSGAW